ncbi:MAG: hypothetical protein J6S40_09190 [Thermoguttaceae bacterium]|nr:hypothetical protein [Thermoguttaceae bacterium]
MQSAPFGLSRRLLRLVCAVVAALGLFPLLPGCSSFEHHQYIFWGEIVPQHPEELEDHWSDYGPFLPDDHTKKMRRGKAGVLRFYKKGDFERSIPVDGELVVYVFEGHDDGIELTRPKYKLIVDSERLNRQRKFDKENGYSYHIWLDLGEVDQPEEAISILAVFTESKTRDQVASGITYTQIGGEPTHDTDLKGSRKGDLLKKTLDEKSKDPKRQTTSSDGNTETKDSDAERGKENKESNELLSINLSDSLAEHIASAPAPVIDESAPRAPVRTAMAAPESSSESAQAEEPLIGSQKLTFDQLHSVGSPTFGKGGYFSQGVVGENGAEPATTPTAEPNLLDGKQAGGAKVLYQ